MPPNDFISTSNLRMNPLERVTQGRPVIDTNHAQVHAGNAFHVSEEIVALASGSSLVFTVDIPAGNYVHLQLIKAVLSQVYSLTITEGDTPTTGTEKTILQRHRPKAATDVSELTAHDAAVSANTVQLFAARYPSSIQGGSGIIDETLEWILAAGKSYTITITNRGAQNADGFMLIDWYEEAGF